MKTNSLIALGAGAILLVGATAGASVYMMEKSPDETSYKISAARGSAPEIVRYSEAQPPPFPDCDDDNIVGTAGGSLSGEEYFPVKNVTCN